MLPAGHGHSADRRKPLPASHVTYRLTNPLSYCPQLSQYLLAACLKNGKLGTLYLCSGFTRWHYSMYVPEGTDAIKIPYKELCCRSKMALSSTLLKSKLSCLPYCSLVFSLPLHVRFRKKSSTYAVPNMTWFSVVPQSDLPTTTKKDNLCSLYYCWILYKPGGETVSEFQETEAPERVSALRATHVTHFQIPTWNSQIPSCWEGKAFKSVAFGLWQSDKNVSVRNFKARHGFKEGQLLMTAVCITVILRCPSQN